jgi:hypothetical protein
LVQTTALVVVCTFVCAGVSISQGAARISLLVKPHVLLIQGRSGPYVWRMLTHRENASQSARHRPCIDVSITRSPSPVATAPTFYTCGPVVPLPRVVGITAGTGHKSRTLVGMAFSRNVRTILVASSAFRSRQWFRTRLLSVSKANRAGVERFRFAAAVLKGSRCVHRLRGFNAKGKLVTDTGPQSCDE